MEVLCACALLDNIAENSEYSTWSRSNAENRQLSSESIVTEKVEERIL